MKLTFNKNPFLAFLILFAIEVVIAYFLKTGFIRHTVGDLLVVILVYCFFRSFIQTKPIYIALLTLLIAYIIELLQLTTFLEALSLDQNKWANLILGNSFSVQDLIAYTLGIVVTLFFEKGGLIAIYKSGAL